MKFTGKDFEEKKEMTTVDINYKTAFTRETDLVRKRKVEFITKTHCSTYQVSKEFGIALPLFSLSYIWLSWFL